MWTLLLVVTLGGLAAVSWHLSRRLGRIEQGLRDLRLLKREVEEMRADVERSLAVTRTHLALVAAGQPPERSAGAAEPPAAAPTPTAISYHGGSVSEAQVVAAIRECYDPEIPINIYDLGLVYGIDIAEAGIAVKMTLTSEGCPSARTIPEDVKRKIAALGQPNVTVDVVWDPPWHPSRISPDGKQKLGLG